MKRLLPFVFCLFFLVACEKEEDGMPEVQAQYVLKEIQYSLGEGDGVREELENMLPRTIENNLSSEIKYTNRDLENIKEQSLFKSDDPNAFLLPESDSIVVPTPSLISGETIFTKEDYFYVDSLQYGVPSGVLPVELMIKPNQKLTVSMQVRWRVVTATYVVVFKDKVTGLEKSATGKWVGKTFSGYNDNYTYDDIK